MADVSSWNLSKIKADLVKANREFSSRRLMHSAKWYIVDIVNFMLYYATFI
jgi:hypothetical protein